LKHRNQMNLEPVPVSLQDTELNSTEAIGMQNRLWKDLTDRLAKELFEGIYWGWGPQWVTFIKIDYPITMDKPLWTHEESSLDTIRLFDLSPDQLQLEIIRYWQQPFWKRWFLSLFTSINNKIKLWSYYHRCLAVRKASIENIYRIDKPIDSLFEQYLGEEIVQSLYRTTLKLTKYLEKHAGDFKFEENGVDFYLRGNGRFFTKLMKEKLDSLTIEDKNCLQKQLKKEFDRHEMMLFSYLTDWEEKIFDEPIYFDKPIPLDICIDPRTGKKMTYSTQSIEEWVKLKRQMLKLMLRNNSPEQFVKIKTFLESTLSTIKQLFNQQLERYEKLIHKVRCERLAPDKAIRQASLLQKDFILFKKIVLLFHPDKSFGNENLQPIQTELFKDFSCLAKESIEKVKQGLQTLEECLITQKNKLAFFKMRNKFILRIAELEKIRDDLSARLEEVDGKIVNNHKETRQEVKEKLWQTETEIEKMHSSYCNYSDFIKPRAPLTRAPLKLMFKPLNNPKQDEPKEQEKHGAYEAQKSRPPGFRRHLRRYTPVF
jgi:hypothetical protein